MRYKEGFISWNDLLAVYNNAANPTEGALAAQKLVAKAQKDQEAQKALLDKQKMEADEALKKQKERVDSIYQYQQWVGYLYANSAKNSAILNDLKLRAFQRGCMFRRDWVSNNPTTPNSFMPSASANEATNSYRAFLRYLSKGISMDLLGDARTRFFTEGCDFLNPIDISSYAAGPSVSFK